MYNNYTRTGYMLFKTAKVEDTDVFVGYRMPTFTVSVYLNDLSIIEADNDRANSNTIPADISCIIQFTYSMYR